MQRDPQIEADRCRLEGGGGIQSGVKHRTDGGTLSPLPSRLPDLRSSALIYGFPSRPTARFRMRACTPARTGPVFAERARWRFSLRIPASAGCRCEEGAYPQGSRTGFSFCCPVPRFPFAVTYPANPQNGVIGVRSKQESSGSLLMNSTPPPTGSSSPLPISNSRHGFRLTVVADDGGQPIAGAPVVVHVVTMEQWERREDLFTDSDGVCWVPVPGESLIRLDVGVNATGWVPRFVSWRSDREEPLPSGHTLRLSPATVVQGIVLNPQRQPIPGVSVKLLLLGSGGPEAVFPIEERLGFPGVVTVAITDTQGRWSSCQCPPAAPGVRCLQFEFEHPDFIPAKRGCESESDSIDCRVAEVTLQPGAVVSGRVLDSEGRPVAGARLRAREHHLPDAVSAKDGTFLLAQLEPGPVNLVVSADSWAPQLCPAVAGGPPIEIRLGPAGVLRFRVMNEEGEPVARAFVALERWREEWSEDVPWRAHTDSDGRVEWNGAPPLESVSVCVGASGFTYARGVQLSANGREQTVTLHRAREAVGSVVDAETRQPIPSFGVLPGYGHELPAFEPGESRRGNEGSFRLRFNERGGHWVRVVAPGYEEAELELTPHREIARNRFRVDSHLRKAGTAPGLQGTVFLPGGVPAVGVQVALCTLENGASLAPGRFETRFQSTPRLTHTDAQGRFAFPAVRFPHTVFAASPDGFGRARVRAGHDCTVLMQPWGRIEGRVILDGKPAAHQVVYLASLGIPRRYRTLHPDLKSFRAQTDSQGQFAMETVPPGAYCLFLEQDPPSSGTHKTFVNPTPIRVVPGETLQVRIGEPATGGLTVVGRMILADSRHQTHWKLQEDGSNLVRSLPHTEPPEGVSREAAALWELEWNESEEGQRWHSSITAYGLKLAADGTFQAQGVSPGKYRISAKITPVEESEGRPRTLVLLGRTPQGQQEITIQAPDGFASGPVDIGVIEVRHGRPANG